MAKFRREMYLVIAKWQRCEGYIKDREAWRVGSDGCKSMTSLMLCLWVNERNVPLRPISPLSLLYMAVIYLNKLEELYQSELCRYFRSECKTWEWGKDKGLPEGWAFLLVYSFNEMFAPRANHSRHLIFQLSHWVHSIFIRGSWCFKRIW